MHKLLVSAADQSTLKQASGSRKLASIRRAVMESMEPRRLMSTYYISPTGSDTNDGLSANTPWQTVTKVDASTFQPGDSVLFQYGSTFRGSLTIPSSGTTAQPITFGAYGDSTLSNPKFLGSDILDTSTFTLLTGTTYSVQSTTPINWLYDNDAFMQESQDALIQSGSGNSNDPATNISYVEAHPNFFYYDANSTTLYVNRGGSFAEQIITAATRQDAIFSNAQNNLIITNLDASETADDNGGYGVRIQGSSNVQLTNVNATLTGKHAIGSINSTGVVATNLTADGSAPNQGFGGASAFVMFSDSTRSGDTTQWINCTYTNPGGQYPVFVTHGDPGSIASILLKNIVSLNGYGTGMDLESTGSTERITIEGGEVDGAVITIATDNTVVAGMKIADDDGGFDLLGSGDVIQNCVFYNLNPNIDAGHNGGVFDEGTNNTVRFNTFSSAAGPGVFIKNANAATNIYANIFQMPQPMALDYTGTGTFSSNYNVYSDGKQFILGGTGATTFATFAQWQALGYDTNSVQADPGFVDSSSGNLQLTITSPAIDLYKSTPDATLVAVTDDFTGQSRPVGGGYDAGAYELVAPITGTVSTADTTVPAPLPGTTAPAVFTVTLSSAQSLATTISYTTVDGTAVAGTDYTATSGVLTFPAGVTTQVVSVPLMTTLDANSSKTFQLVLSSPSIGISLGNATATATVSNAGETTVTFDKKTPASYTDSSGKKVTLKLGGLGTGTALFTSGDANPVQIVLTQTTAGSSFTASSIGGPTSLQDIDVQGSLGAFTTTANLSGDFEVTGTIGRLTAGNVTAVIALDGTTGKPALKFGAVTNTTLVAKSGIGAITAASWSGPITAVSLGTLSVKGAMSGNVTLTGGGVTLGAAKAGSITSGTWAVAGITGSVTAASITSWEAGLTGGLRSLKVTGAFSNSTLRASGNVGPISVGAAVNSNFFAGVNSSVTGLPTNSDLVSNNQITSFTITAPKGITNAFVNSNVSAAKILNIKVQRVETANNGTSFGFFTDALTTFVDIEPGKKTFSWNFRQDILALSFSGDFKVS